MPDLPALGGLADAAHVDQVRRAGEDRDQAAAEEGGGDDDEVVEVAGSLPGIVGDEDVAFDHAGHGPTEAAMVLMWPGVPVTACANMRPRRSNTPAEMSPASRADVLKAVRTRVWPCSSTTERSRFQRICPVISEIMGRLPR